MSSRKEIAEHIAAKLHAAGDITLRKMFGEYGIWLDGKLIVVIADDRLFFKITQAGRHFIGQPEEDQPYPGSKPWFLIPEEMWEESAWLVELARITALELPAPKPKKPRNK